MSLPAVVARGRVRAEALMVDTVSVKSKTTRAAQNETTGAETQQYETSFTSKAKIQSSSLESTDPEVGGRRQAIDSIELHLPITAPQVEQGQVVEVTAVGAGSDSRLVGRQFVVAAPMNKTHATATRLRLKELP